MQRATFAHLFQYVENFGAFLFIIRRREYVREEALGSLRRAVFEGDTTTGSLMAGQVAGMLHEVRPVADILADLWDGGRQRIAALNELC